MIKVYLLIFLLFFSGCSLNSKSKFWTESTEIKIEKKNTTILFQNKTIIDKEFNKNFIIDTQNLKIDDDFNFLTNHHGIQKFNREINKKSRFRFSKIKNFNYFETDLVFDGRNFIFFDNKGNIIKFDRNFRIIWKKNFYSKQEKKFDLILSMYSQNNLLIVFDNIGKYYAINGNSGELIWSKNNTYPFNSQIKIFDEKVYAVDLNNILRCFSIKDGKELWNYKSENTFLKSTKRNSLIILNDLVYFNNSLGDIISVNAQNGNLQQYIPTQSSAIYENAFSLIMSDLVADKDNLISSNNRNEFYSINHKNGVLRWKQEINSSVRPIFFENFIFTISNEGYFFVLDRNNGNILRITDIFDGFNNKKRKNIKPVGFIAGTNFILLSTNNGKVLTINIRDGKTKSILKIHNNKISKPFVFEKEVLIIKDDSIIRLN